MKQFLLYFLSFFSLTGCSGVEVDVRVGLKLDGWGGDGSEGVGVGVFGSVGVVEESLIRDSEGRDD